MDIAPATSDELPAAFELALGRLDDDTRRTRVFNALTLVASGEIDPAGIFLAKDDGGLRGVQVSILLPGASGLFWLPRTEPFDENLEERLVQAALDWLGRRGAKLASAILTATDAAFVGPLERCGFRHVTRMVYLSHELEALPAEPAPRLGIETYSERNEQVFHDTLMRTYEGTLDCPELNGVRSIEEIIAGHKAQGQFRPQLWWLARAGVQLVGVVLITVIPETDNWDIEYVGVVPEARWQGHGRELIARALQAARQAQVPKVILVVDERNEPALQLYRQMGFATADFREVYLYFRPRSLAAAPEQHPSERSDGNRIKH